MRKWVPWMLVLALWPVAPGQAAAVVPLDLKDAISAVTVYPDRAMVTRTARATLTPGLYALRFARLPGGLQPESLRVRLLAGSQAIVRSFDVRTRYTARPSVPQFGVIKSQLAQLKQQERVLRDGRAVEERQFEAARRLQGETTENLGKVLGSGKAQVKDWPLVLQLVRQQQEQALKGMQDIDAQLALIEQKRKPLEAELARLEAYEPSSYYEVPLTLEVQAAGTVSVAVDYLLSDASWAPTYDARLSADGKRLEWDYQAQIVQRTGEDWRDVKLSLSTSAPAEGSEPPEVGDWFLGRMEPMAEEDEQPRENIARKMQSAPAGAALADRARLAPSPQRAARVVDQGTSVTLEAPDPVSIPSDGQEHRAFVGRTAMDVTGHYRLVPRLSPSAFLEVEGKFPGPWPLLPGQVKHYVGLDYVGTSPVGQVVPGQDLTLAMGTDRAVKVKRKRLAMTRGQSGIIGKVRFAEYHYEVQLENLKPGAQRFTLVETLPQTTLQEISIKLLEQTPSFTDTTEPGVLRWDLDLSAGGKKTLKWGYRVEYPVDLPITGLE